MTSIRETNRLISIPIVAFMVLVLFLSYYSPDESFFRVHDYLDHFFVLQKLWSEQIGFLNFENSITNVFSGLNGNLLGFNDFSLIQILLKFFDPFVSLIAHDVFIRFLGFIGIVYLLNSLSNSENSKTSLVNFFALIYALFPTVPSYTSTFQSFPIMTFIAIKMFEKPTIFLSTLFFIFSQNISFVYGGFAFYLMLFLATIWLVYSKQINLKKFVTIQLISIATIVFVNLRMLYSLFINSAPTQRSEWVAQSNSLNSDFLALPLKLVKSLFIFDPNSGYTLGSPIILLFALGFIGFLNFSRININGSVKKTFRDPFISLFFIILSFIFFNLSAFETVKFNSTSFQISRGYIFVSFLYIFFLFTLIIKLVSSKALSKKITEIVVIFAITISLVNFYPIQARLQNFAIDISVERPELLEAQKDVLNRIRGLNLSLSEFKNKVSIRRIPTLNEYYQVNNPFFRSNLNDLKADGKIFSIGVDPMVLAWNGWNVFNGYVFNYPLQHKQQFISIVEDKMATDSEYRKYIKEWGNRLILSLDPKDYSLYGVDFCRAKLLDVNYLISDEFILNNKNLQSQGNLGGIHVYRISC